MRDDPRLRDIPIAIGGPENTRSVLSTANYAACLEVMGVRSAMANIGCQTPKPAICECYLVIMHKYRRHSEQMHVCIFPESLPRYFH